METLSLEAPRADDSQPKSAKLPFTSEVTSQSRSFNEIYTVNRVRGVTHLPLTKSKSWSCTPRPCEGIPLGSLTAQAAAKPFWGKEMLQERIQEIAEFAALETSSLGSSIEDNLSTTVEELEEQDIPSFAVGDVSRDMFSKSAPVTPRQQSPAVHRTQSAQPTKNSKTRHTGKPRTPSSASTSPTLATRTVKSAPLSSARLTKSATDLLSVEGKRMQLSPRNMSPIRDDGFHE